MHASPSAVRDHRRLVKPLDGEEAIDARRRGLALAPASGAHNLVNAILAAEVALAVGGDHGGRARAASPPSAPCPTASKNIAWAR
jgi:hypothetical protein